MEQTPNSFRGVIDLWPSRSAIADALAPFGVTLAAVSKWHERDSIPSRFWVPLRDAAILAGISAVTLDLLAALDVAPVKSEAA